MTSLMRRISLVGTPALLAVSLTACGGSGTDATGAPDDASVADFCDTFGGLGDLVDAGDDADAAVDAANDFAADLDDVGTPSDVTDDQRDGFEAYVKFLGEVDSSDVEDLADSDEADVFGDDADNVTGFIQYAITSCPDALGSLTGDVPDVDVPELPSGSDLPELPSGSDLPDVPELPDLSDVPDGS